MAIHRLQACNRLLGSIPVSEKTHEPGLRTAPSAPDADLFCRPGFVPPTSYSLTYTFVVLLRAPGDWRGLPPGTTRRRVLVLRKW